MEFSAIGLLTILHIIFILALIVLVLLQDSKGGAMGIFSGGGSSSVFGSSGGTDFLVKATRYISIGFAVTCLSLTYITSHQKGSVVDSVATPIATDAIPSMNAGKATETQEEAKAEETTETK